MRASSFRYLVKDGARSLWKNRLMSFASIGVLVACLILIGAAGLFAANVSSVVGYVEQQNEIVVFLEDEITDAQRDTVQNTLDTMGNVKSSTYISREAALEEQKEKMGALLDGLESNPYPASYRVKLNDLAQLKETVDKLQALPGVDTVTAQEDVAGTLVNISNIVALCGAGIVLVLIIVSLVIISNTIRLTVFSRRKEINIMKYVGATNTFIRLPFIVEGFLLGLLSACLSFGIMWLAYTNIISHATSSGGISFLSSAASSLLPFEQVALPLFLSFAVAGIVTGVLGSVISMRKHLKV